MRIRERVLRIRRSYKEARQPAPPAESLTTLLLRQEESLARVRGGLAAVAAERTRLGIRFAEAEKQAELLQLSAQAALGAGDERTAREALARKITANQRLAELVKRDQELAAEQEALTSSFQNMRLRLDALRDRVATQDGTALVAEARLHSARAFSPESGGLAEVERRLARAEAETKQLRATAVGLEELRSQQSAVAGETWAEIDVEFRKLEIVHEVEAEIVAFRADESSQLSRLSSPKES